MQLLVIGAGYVGLVSAVCFAEMGQKVLCLDIDEKKIDTLKKGDIPIFEPGLTEMLKRNVKAGRLKFTSDYQSAVEKSHICFIAVDTPSDESGACNLSYVKSVARSIGQWINDYKIIVMKSTVPVGTHQVIESIIEEQLSLRNRGEIEFDLASNPEFLKEGCAINDFMKPDRVILGVPNSKVANTLKELYQPFMKNHDRILIMDLPSAEMAKYASNAMLATRISFMNELSGLCEKLGADINKVRQGMGSDSRIGYDFLYAGVGFGGSCFPKDIRALAALARDNGLDPQMLQAVESVNEKQKHVLSNKIIEHFEELKGKTIALWGLAFKPDTDDMREAPSLNIIDDLLREGAVLRLYDPISMDNAKRYLEAKGQKDKVIWCESEMEAAKGADAVALITEWKQFRFVDFYELKEQMQGEVIFDGRNQYCSHEVNKAGFHYYSIGQRPKLLSTSTELEESSL